MTLSAWLSGGLASLLSLVELANARRKSICLRATPLVAIRLAFEFGTGILAYSLLVLAFEGLKWFTGPWPVVIAGLAGPALLRSQLALIGSGQESAAYGPANIYRKFQGILDRWIDDVSSVVQSDWIVSKATPAIKSIPLASVQDRAVTYIKGLDSLPERDRIKRIKWIKDTTADRLVSEDDKYTTIIQYLLDNGGRRLVRSMARRGRIEAAASGSRRQKLRAWLGL